MKNVYIIGHRQPDTDSVASVIGYAEFLNLREPGRYIPAVCGPLNAETRYALAELRVDPPLFVESVEPCVGDIPAFYTQRAPAEMPTIDVAAMMDEQEVRNIPIVDKEARLVGLVSEHGLARAYVTPKLGEPLTIGPITGETLARILDARICNQGPLTIHGRVYIVIDALHVALSRLASTDVRSSGTTSQPSWPSFLRGLRCSWLQRVPRWGRGFLRPPGRTEPQSFPLPLTRSPSGG